MSEAGKADNTWIAPQEFAWGKSLWSTGEFQVGTGGKHHAARRREGIAELRKWWLRATSCRHSASVVDTGRCGEALLQAGGTAPYTERSNQH